MAKVHWTVLRHEPWPWPPSKGAYPRPRPLCDYGWTLKSFTTTRDKSEVTCKRCLAALKKEGGDNG